MMRGAYIEVTIWNRWRNPATNKDEWFRRIIPNCSWEQKIVTNTSGTGAVVASAYSVLIAENPNYRPYREWADMSEADKKAFFTFNTSDLMAKGTVDLEITGVQPFRESDLKLKLSPDVFNVKVIDDQTEPYKRGRHYLVMGV